MKEDGFLSFVENFVKDQEEMEDNFEKQEIQKKEQKNIISDMVVKKINWFK